MKKRKLIHIITYMLMLSLLLGAGTPVTTYAADKTKEKRTVRVAFPSQAGMSEVGVGGDLIGYNYEYLENVAEYTGWNLEYITYEDQSADDAIMSAMEQVMSGEADLIGPMLYSEQVSEMFEFPENHYGVVYTTLCALEKGNTTSINYAKIEPLRVAVYEKATTRNEEVETYLDQLGIQYELILCDSTEKQYEMLENGDADVLSSITLSYFEGTRTVARFAPRTYYMVSTKGNSELIEELDAAITKISKSQPNLQGELQEKYFGDTSGGYVLTEDEQNYMNSVSSMHVLCAKDYAPYVMKDKSGNATGLIVSILNDFAKENDATIEYTFCEDADKLENEWYTGEYDCVIGLPFTPEYCINYGLIRSDEILSVDMVLYGKQEAKPYAESSVAVYGKYASQMQLDDFKNVVECNTLEDCFRLVQSDEVDYGCTNRLSADYEIFSQGYQFYCTPMIGQQLNLGIAVSNEKDINFLSSLNKYIRTMPESTINSYLSEATRHDDVSGMKMFVRSHPVLAITLVGIMILFCAGSIMLVIYASKNKKWNIKLQKANLAMEQANNAKTEFLARMSHDIRTPMNAILGFARISKQDMHSPEVLENDLDKIISSGEFLLGLINDVLDMTKIESDTMELKPTPYATKEFVSQINTLAEQLCGTRNISFVLKISNDFPECIKVDELRFNQIFFNLLSNAAKYTKPNGRVEMTGERIEKEMNQEWIRVTVKDNGIGMSKDFQKRMFDSFSQENEEYESQQGTGLGLSIVKKLVDLMQGTIQVKSKLGEGSIFTVELPVELLELPVASEVIKEVKDKNELVGKKILLCEDHPINTQLACRLLEDAGMIITCAENGAIGVDIFSKSVPHEYDAILMDIRMPVMDGIEATKQIRNLDRKDAKQIPIIAMTANAFSDDVKQTMEAGMIAHISKPIEVEKLYQTLENAMKEKLNKDIKERK